MHHPCSRRSTNCSKRTEQVMLGGGADKLEKQRKAGKLTARERIDALVDPDSFEETGLFAEHRVDALRHGRARTMPADGVVTGAASVGGRLVHLASQDFTVAGGSAGEVHSIKVAEIMTQSLKTGSPVRLHQRFRRRARAGGHRFALRLRQGLLHQRHALRRGAADLADLRTLRRRRGLQPGADRFHHPDAQARRCSSPGPQVIKR